MIVEDLTKANYGLLMACREHPNAVSVWSRMGKIYVKTLDLQILTVDNPADLSLAEINMDSVPASTPNVINIRGGRGRGRGGYRRLTDATLIGRRFSQSEGASDEVQ